MINVPTPTRSQLPQHRQQLSLPFRATDSTPPLVIEPQRTAVTALLVQMLIDAVLAEARTKTANDKKEVDDE